MATITPKQALDLAKEKKAHLRRPEVHGLPRHLAALHHPASTSSREDVFEEGLGFDGSSIRGWQAIHASDMLVMPDADTAVMDPFMARADAVAHLQHRRAHHQGAVLPRPAQHRHEGREVPEVAPASATPPTSAPRPSSSSSTRSATTSASTTSFYKVDSVEGQWNTGREEAGGNLGYKPRYKEGYFPVAPTDSQQDIRTEMCRVMEAVGIQVERQHHEVATAGQAEIDIRFDALTADGRQAACGSSTSSRTWPAGTARP